MEVFGGPWDKKFVLLPREGTLVFTLYGFRGFYTKHGVWHDVR